MRLSDPNDLIQDLQLAKQIAIEDRNPNTIIIATMTQARIIGIDRPHMIDVNNDTVQSITDLMNELSNDEHTRAITYE